MTFLHGLGLVFLVASLGMGCSDDTGPSGGSGGSGGEHTGGSNTGGAGGSGGGGSLLADACPVTHEATTNDGHDVTVCEELYPEPPFLRPPADEGSVVIAASDGTQLFVRGEEPRNFTLEEQDIVGLGIRENSDVRRYAYTLYRMERDEGGAIVASAPALIIEDAAFHRFFEGFVLEGLISRHRQDPENPNFDFEDPPTLPIRLELDAPSASTDMDPTLDVITLTEVHATVANLEDGVLSSQGECLTAVRDAGAEDPFDGADPMLRLLRVPSMHGPGDNELVIDGALALNHMTSGWMVMPHQLVEDADLVFDAADFFPHGNPLSMPKLILSRVSGGGDPCTPL